MTISTASTSDGGTRPKKKAAAPKVDSLDIIATVRRIARDYLWPQRRRVAIAFAAMLVNAAATGTIPFLLRDAADKIFIERSVTVLYILPFAIATVMVLRSLADYVAKVAQGRVANQLVANLRTQLFDKIAYADLGWLQSTHSGRFVSVFMSDVLMVNNAAVQTLTGLAQNAMQAMVLIVAMFFLDWRLSTFALIALPISAILVRKQRLRARRSIRSTLEEIGSLSTIVSETLKSIRVVKAYDREGREVERARNVIDRTMKFMMKTVRTRAMTGPVTELMAGIGIGAAIFYGGWQGINGEMTLGAFMGFISAALLVYQPMKALASLNNQLVEGTIAARRIFDILDHEQVIVERPGAIPLTVTAGAVRFDNVTFGYNAAHPPVLDRFSLDIPAGSRVALVGPSGAGKSTVINLILRFYDPASGAVLIDGTDVRQGTIGSVRRASALLTQDPVLFDDTILANICYGSEDAPREAVVAAAQAAAAHDFIIGLPDGYDTRVGEAGVALSGGQKQRIAFARAMLRDAPILLLDEPTSALDAQSEVVIQAALDRLSRNRTVLIVAHRLSTIQKADMIVVMDKGRAVEIGTHADLLARAGLYRSLHDSQFVRDDPAAAAPAPEFDPT